MLEALIAELFKSYRKAASCESLSEVSRALLLGINGNQKNAPRTEEPGGVLPRLSIGRGKTRLEGETPNHVVGMCQTYI